MPHPFDPNGWGCCQRSTSTAGRTLGAFVCLLAAVLVLALGWAWLATTPEERVSDALDDARDALVEADAPAFLAQFADEVEYRERGDRSDLESDLDRWVRMPGVRSVRILDREIEVWGEEADVRLVAAVGPNLLRSVRVDVELHLVLTPDGWRVDRFHWER